MRCGNTRRTGRTGCWMRRATGTTGAWYSSSASATTTNAGPGWSARRELAAADARAPREVLPDRGLAAGARCPWPDRNAPLHLRTRPTRRPYPADPYFAPAGPHRLRPGHLAAYSPRPTRRLRSAVLDLRPGRESARARRA